MAWQRLVLHVDAGDLARAESLLSIAGAQSLSISDGADEPLLEPAPGETPLWRSLELSALFPTDVELAGLCDALETALGPATAPAVESLDDEDWIAAWRQRIAPCEFGARLWVVPAEASLEPMPGRELRLGMGLAFGTGRHATTSLCLEWLATRTLDDGDVLDFGCGSGILALAALTLGARRAWAVDNDPQALLATADNAKLNGFDAAIWIGDLDALPPIRADVVLANIVAGTLVVHAGRLAACARPGASIVLSGILESQRADVESAYAAYFEAFECASSDGWVRLVGRRKAPAQD